MENRINNAIKVTIPDEMRLMTEEEMNQLLAGSRIRSEQNWCIRNEEQHTLINICWKKRPLILGRLAPLEAQRDATEKKLIGRVSDYEKLGHGERNIDGVKMCTFRCRYTKQNLGQYGEYDLCIWSNYFYGIQYICREGYQDYAEKKFEELIRSISFC